MPRPRAHRSELAGEAAGACRTSTTKSGGAGRRALAEKTERTPVSLSDFEAGGARLRPSGEGRRHELGKEPAGEGAGRLDGERAGRPSRKGRVGTASLTPRRACVVLFERRARVPERLGALQLLEGRRETRRCIASAQTRSRAIAAMSLAVCMAVLFRFLSSSSRLGTMRPMSLMHPKRSR